MFERLARLFRPSPAPAPAAPDPVARGGLFSTDVDPPFRARITAEQLATRSVIRTARQDVASGVAMDNSIQEVKAANAGYNTGINAAQFGWYAGQGFIGYQACAIIAQNWLVDKACTVPAEDAVRNGWELTRNDGGELTPEQTDALRATAIRMKLDENLVQAVRMNRVFGVRIVLFLVDSSDPDYYEKPFNPDGVRPGSYRGISQIDPYWVTPELSMRAASDPSSPDFYEPTWWRISGKRYHRSHLVVLRGPELPDILKPTYLYGGLPLTQKIAERVFAAERTANEAPQLALSKRTTIYYTDVAQAIANEDQTIEKANWWSRMWNNFGIKFADKEADEVQQFDTSLGDLDNVIMTQYQVCAAIANTPATKLLGTVPKGFNSTGEYEEASYHEMLESIQTHQIQPIIDRHNLLAIRSEIAPGAPFHVTVVFNPLDAMTAKEQAEVNKLKAETDELLVQAGAIDGQDIRARITADPDSGYNGAALPVPEDANVEPTDGGE